MPVLQVPSVCLCPQQADPALSSEVAARQPHSSLTVLLAAESSFLIAMARAVSLGGWWWERICISEHPEGWLSIRQCHKIIVFLRSKNGEAQYHYDSLRDIINMVCI